MVTDAGAAFPVQKVVRTDPQIEHAAWLHTVGVMVVILLSGLREHQ